jgi:hypothetical protein
MAEDIPDAVHAAAAKVLCRSGKFETGQGTCAPICMQFLGDPRNSITGCGEAMRVHGALALAVLRTAIPAPTNDHTD